MDEGQERLTRIWRRVKASAKEEKRYVIALCLIFLLGFLLRMGNTADSPHLVKGIDGPYYVSQVNYLRETGESLHKDSPLAFYYLLIWRYMAGDTVVGIKIGMSVITGLFAFPTYLLVRKITGDRNAAIFSAFLSVFNPYLFSMTYNLYKNEIGVLLLLVFFVLFFRFVSTDGLRRKWKELLPLLLIFVAIWGTHIMATGMTVLFTVSYFILALLRERTTAKRMVRLGAAIAVIGGCAVLILAAAFPSSFYKVYKLRFLTDLLEDEGDVPRFAPPREDQQGRVTIFVFRNLDPVKWFGFPAVLGVIVILRKIWKRQNLPGEAFILTTYLSWLVFVQPSISHELVWRFALVSFVPISLAAGYGLAVIHRKTPLLVALPLIAIVLGLSFIEASAVARRSRTTITEAEYMELLDIRKVVPERCEIIGGVGSAYWYEVVLGKKIVRSHYVEDEPSTVPLLLIEQKRRAPPRPGDPQPPSRPPSWLRRAEEIWNGNHYIAYVIPPRPH